MKTSIIIYAYNDEQTIKNIIVSFCMYNIENEVIVIDSGSNDYTEVALNELRNNYKFIYEKLPKNYGQGWIFAYGVSMAQNEIILFLDARVLQIKGNHLKCLINPILSGSVDMVLGQPSEIIINYKINPFRSLAGVRVLLKEDILPILDDIKKISFGIETYLELYFQAKGKTIKYVLLGKSEYNTDSLKAKQEQELTKNSDGWKELTESIIEDYILLLQRLLINMKDINTSSESEISLTECKEIYEFLTSNNRMVY